MVKGFTISKFIISSIAHKSKKIRKRKVAINTIPFCTITNYLLFITTIRNLVGSILGKYAKN